MRKKLMTSFIVFVMILSISFLSVNVSAAEASVCCEKTTSGLYCQNVAANECAAGSRQAPTSCNTASFCKPGVCYNSGQGTCAENTPQIVCNQNKGVWSETSPPQCSLGCCVLGDQAAFVTLTRCKYLSSTLGLTTNYNSGIRDEVACVQSVQNQDRGACVFEFEFERTCKFTTRSECDIGLNNTGKGDFFAGKLCSAPELATKCTKTKNTVCNAGKDEVYFVDSCGNPANIYDASKIDNEEYWSNVKTKAESCSPNGANANSKACGNCNYLQGSYCRTVQTTATRPTYGNNICADLNCKNTENGKSYKHGESWCVYDDEGEVDKADNSVGSRFYKHICVNGEEVLEQCADFRQEECIQSNIETSVGDFSQAACRVNRWQDCTAQENEQDCVNTDRRDCSWKELTVSGSGGVCLPKNTPGIKFWEGEESSTICKQADTKCIVTFEKGIVGGEKCIGNCECLTESWKKERGDICKALGDCGPKINWVGDSGYKTGLNITRK